MLQESLKYINSKISTKPKIGVVLGSGLGDFGTLVKNPQIISTKDIPHYPVSSVQGHSGKIIFGKIKFEGKESPELMVFQGRIHFYETNDVQKVVYPIQIASALGVEILLITNAAGGINRKFESGTLMFIRDYINLTGENPLIGNTVSNIVPNNITHEVFDKALLRKAKSLASEHKIPTEEGVYVWTKGPTYESAAEIRMMGKIGSDAVGMSTVPEVILANHLGLKVLGISCITNMATGISPTKLSHAEVNETANRVKNNFTKLVSSILVNTF
ncbi:MAG: purine-nucleoside phosphorylase [Bacteroidota bacterium]|nr:purine-nucleoside phosphorylase [Bacteroidota bacterium]